MNPIEIAVKQHYSSVEAAICKLVDLYEDDFDIEDPALLKSVLLRYGLLKDGFCSEKTYIIKEVKRRIIK